MTHERVQQTEREDGVDTLVERLLLRVNTGFAPMAVQHVLEVEPRKRICVIVPAYNEVRTLEKVVRGVFDHCAEADVVVVNDASTDGTLAVARRLNVEVLDLPINLGIGGAMQTGFLYAASRGYEIVVQVDGDGQHDSAHIPQLTGVLDRGEADVVIGSRFLRRRGFRSTFIRQLGIKIFTLLIGWVTDKWIFDPTSGFRAYNQEALWFAAQYYPSDFPEPESIVTFLRNGFRVKEIPVVMRKRQGGVSSVRPLKGTYFVFSNAVAIVMSGLKRRVRML